ncbi:Ricin-type beta-trefoil lectin domain protein [Pelomyxa schiedti]|nr:Ricin-type beta-trefoil lectin domain protein [Pelomyxa schiedti]
MAAVDTCNIVPAVCCERTKLAVKLTRNAYNFGCEPFTVEAWIKPNRFTGTIISRKPRGGGYDNGGWLIYLEDPNVITFATDDGYGYCCLSSKVESLMDGRWHHIAVARNFEAMNIYLDGVNMPGRIGCSKRNPLDVDSRAPLYIGYSQQRRDFYDGLVADVRIWSYRRDPSLFGKEPQNTELPYLVGCWQFKEGKMDDYSHFQNALVPKGTFTIDYSLSRTYVLSLGADTTPSTPIPSPLPATETSASTTPTIPPASESPILEIAPRNTPLAKAAANAAASTAILIATTEEPLAPPEVIQPNQRTRFMFENPTLLQFATFDPSPLSYQAVFDLFDRLKSPEIAVADFGLLLSLIDPATNEDMKKLFHAIDIDGDGEVTLKELLIFKVMTSVALGSFDAESVTTLFNLLDSNGNGVLEWSEVAPFAAKFGLTEKLKAGFFGDVGGAVNSKQFHDILVGVVGKAEELQPNAERNTAAAEMSALQPGEALDVENARIKALAAASGFQNVISIFDNLKTPRLLPCDLALVYAIIDPSLVGDSRALFDAMDINHDGRLSLKEVLLFQVMANIATINDPRSPQSLPHFRFMFDLLDEDSSGTLEWSEVEAFAAKFDLTGDFQAMFAGKPSITLDELLAFLQSS